MEVYEVHESGETEFLNVNSIQDAIDPKKVLLILDHEKKTVFIYVGKEATTRLKFSSARSSRSLLQERNLAYRVKTLDEDDADTEEWLKSVVDKVIRTNIRTEPPPLEILKILRKIQSNSPPIDGYVSDAAIIKSKFYKFQSTATTIMGKNHTIEKFEQVTNLPEGFYLLPGEYKVRLIIEKGKVVGIEFLKPKSDKNS
ncbi:MAG: hypothetical protein ACTSRP_00745 [Candidatus Helarchaeota archaeon]